MDVVMYIGNAVLRAIIQLLLNPFYYIGVLIVVLQFRRQIWMERKLFSTKLHSLVGETLRAVLWGMLGGVLASVLMAFVGATLQPEALLLLWGVSMLLALIRIRFLCMAYSAGLLGVLQAVVSYIPGLTELGEQTVIVKSLLAIHMPSLFSVVAVLHLVEAVLIRLQGARTASPMFYESKRGRIVGGYQLQGFWPIPLLLLVPMPGSGLLELSWQPLLGGELWHYGWLLAGFPFMLGFGESTTTRLPKEKARFSSTLLIGYSLLLFLCAWSTEMVPILLAVTALLCMGLHEVVLMISRADDQQRSSLYVHGRRGLTVLAVLPGSAAEQMGIEVGEIIHKINGFPVMSKQELHAAMRLNSAFCRLEIFNNEGQSKFTQHALFAGEHHQLGIVLAPDQEAMYYAEEQQPSVFAFIRKSFTGIVSSPESRNSDASM
jgi:membrane-associated protease RseP (regulator of RpoE activity)